MKYLFLSLRPRHWVKNLLIFLPLVFGMKLYDFLKDSKVILAFLLFSLAASAVYLINDIIDIEKDKLHPIKRLRPIASGKIGAKKALFAAVILGFLSAVFSFRLNVYFGWIIIIYLGFNLIYSGILKDLVIIDVFCIGVFYLLRISAGIVVAGVEMSYWIIIMTTLLALFVGFTKRKKELELLNFEVAQHRSVLNKYSPYFIDQMVMIITSSIVISYILYTVDARTIRELGTKNLIYSMPFVYYGIFRYLYLIQKIRKEDDPVVILFSDRMMQLNILLCVAVCIFVIYWKI